MSQGHDAQIEADEIYARFTAFLDRPSTTPQCRMLLRRIMTDFQTIQLQATATRRPAAEELVSPRSTRARVPPAQPASAPAADVLSGFVTARDAPRNEEEAEGDEYGDVGYVQVEEYDEGPYEEEAIQSLPISSQARASGPTVAPTGVRPQVPVVTRGWGGAQHGTTQRVRRG
ncbi:MAG: hypothetical protein M1816_007358 [Peltula sp. TS41687]|nr:MAG: hypothetical protein M1816_007358 [Peltula sp. TS41687]